MRNFIFEIKQTRCLSQGCRNSLSSGRARSTTRLLRSCPSRKRKFYRSSWWSRSCAQRWLWSSLSSCHPGKSAPSFRSLNRGLMWLRPAGAFQGFGGWLLRWLLFAFALRKCATLSLRHSCQSPCLTLLILPHWGFPSAFLSLR